jgi:carboxylesterase
MVGAEPFSSPGTGARAATGVLCIHGLTATPQMVRPVAENLADLGYAVSAPLLPGHGRTSQQLNRTRYDDWAAAVEVAALELRRERRHLVVFGVSLGGALATEVTVRHPDLVDGLVLVNPAFAATDWRLRVLPYLKYVLPSLAGLADDIRRDGPPRELAYDVMPLKAFHSFVRRWPALVAALPQVRTPVLLARSAHDRVVPRISAERFLEHVGSDDVTELVLPESGHVATLDHDAELLIAETARFVERVTA